MAKVLSAREKKIAWVTAGLFIFSAAYHFWIGPFLSKADTLARELKGTRGKLQKSRALLSQKAQIEKRYQELTGREISAEPLPQDSYSATLSELEGFARDAGIRISDIRPYAAGNAAMEREGRVDIRTEGSLEGFMKFLYALENSLSLLQVKKLQISSQSSGELLDGSFSISKVSVE